MNTRRLIYALPLIAVGILISDLAVSKLTGFTSVNRAWDVPGTGVTTRKDCSSCHSGLTPIAQDMVSRKFTLDTGITSYRPGKEYVVKFKIMAATTVGFSSTVLRNDLNSFAGTLTAIDTNQTKVFLHTASGRYYMNHRVGTTTSGAIEYSYKWTAPVTGTGPVTFYFSSLTANNDDLLDNDTVYNNSYVITEFDPTGVAAVSEIASLSVFPNPASEKININFIAAAKGNATVSLISIDGKEAVELMNENLNSGNQNLNLALPANLKSGIYFIKVSMNDRNLVQKILVN